MYHNGYSVRVVGGDEVRDGYVEMQHGQQFSLRLRNSRPARCDAKVVISGKHVGTWRIDGYGSIQVEHPDGDDGKFTFYELGTREAAQIGSYGGENAGLVSVTFMPEHEQINDDYFGVIGDGMKSLSHGPATRGATRGMASKGGMSAGDVGLSGRSHQKFRSVRALDYDHSNFVTINLRLVCVDNETPRPLVSKSTPVPPPVQM